MSTQAVSLLPDSLYDEACKIATAAGYVSTSLLCMRLRIGYARAAGLIDEMERQDFCEPIDYTSKIPSRRRLTGGQS